MALKQTENENQVTDDQWSSFTWKTPIKWYL